MSETRTCGVDGYVCDWCGVQYGGRIHDCDRTEEWPA